MCNAGYIMETEQMLFQGGRQIMYFKTPACSRLQNPCHTFVSGYFCR